MLAFLLLIYMSILYSQAWFTTLWSSPRHHQMINVEPWKKKITGEPLKPPINLITRLDAGVRHGSHISAALACSPAKLAHSRSGSHYTAGNLSPIIQYGVRVRYSVKTNKAPQLVDLMLLQTRLPRKHLALPRGEITHSTLTHLFVDNND